jgi:hypothetical protein
MSVPEHVVHFPDKKLVELVTLAVRQVHPKPVENDSKVLMVVGADYLEYLFLFEGVQVHVQGQINLRVVLIFCLFEGTFHTVISGDLLDIVGSTISHLFLIGFYNKKVIISSCIHV